MTTHCTRSGGGRLFWSGGLRDDSVPPSGEREESLDLVAHLTHRCYSLSV